MEENKFEIQVQQKMDELKIHPSDSVWKKIEMRLEKKRRSNRGLFLLLLLFCVFLTGGYWLWYTGHQAGMNGSNFEKTNSEKNVKEISTGENKATQEKPNLISGSTHQKTNITAPAGIRQSGNKNTSRHHKFSSATKTNLTQSSGEKATMAFSKQQEVPADISENDRKTSIVEPHQVAPASEKVDVAIRDPAHNIVSSDSLSSPSSFLNKKAEVKDTLKPIPASHAIVKRPKKNTWKPGLLFAAGISGVGNNFLGLDNARYNDVTSTPGNGQSTPPPLPSRTKSGFGFIAGAFAERNISAKMKLAVGINFKSFRTSNSVNDSSGTFSSRSNVNTYNNHYNFIELPVTLKIQIGKGKSVPLSWQGGLVVSELISSNALQFNSISGVYYVNNSVFNKTQLGLNTSISAALFSKQKNSVLIGPYFYYAVSGLANQGMYNKKHFVFTGIRTEIIFGK